MAHFALEVADAADLKYGRMLEDTSALKYHQIPIDQFLLYQGYAQINTTARLREMALAYLMAANIDELRQEVHDWDPSTEQRLLNELEAAIQRIPSQVLGLSTEAIRAHFSRFHATMTQRQLDLQSYKEMIAAYDKAQEPADWSWLLELGIGLASNLNPVLKGIDLALTLRDVFINHEPLALAGLVDFIPPSFIRGAGRVLSHLPGTNTIRHLGNDIGAWVDDLARRFGRGAEGKWMFLAHSSTSRGKRLAKEINPDDIKTIGDLAKVESRISSEFLEIGYFFSKEGQVIRAFQGDIDTIRLAFGTKTEFDEFKRLMQGGTFTHNHPRMGHSSLSPADLIMAQQLGLGEIRAVHKDLLDQMYVFSAKPGPSGWNLPDEKTLNQLLEAEKRQFDTLIDTLAERGMPLRTVENLRTYLSHYIWIKLSKSMGFEYTSIAPK